MKNRRDCIVQDPSTKRSLPPGYVSTLEARVAYLEGLLKGDQRAVAMDHMDEDTTSLLATDSSHTQATRATDTAISVPSDKPTTSSTNFLDSCSRPEVDTSYTSPSVQSGTDCHTSPLEMLCMNSAAGQSLYFGASSPLLLSRSINAMLRGVHSLAPGLSMAGVDNELLSELPRPCPVLLPGRFFCDILANSYFTHVHPQFPFIHRPTYDKWQRNVLDAIESAIPPDPMQVFFVYMVRLTSDVSDLRGSIILADQRNWVTGLVRMQPLLSRSTTYFAPAEQVQGD